jgi:integrase
MIVAGWSARTGNLFTQAIGNLLRHAKINNHLRSVPQIDRIKEATKRKRLVTMGEVEFLCSEANRILLNGCQFSDYVRLLAFSGARASEAVNLKWSDVDFRNCLLTIGSDGMSKNAKPRTIEFNGELKRHLNDVHSRRAESSQWIFPAKRTGGLDCIKSFRCHLNRVFARTDIQRFGFHHLRHFFASTCVMSGIDFTTVARWLGHSDGGALLAKTYSHLSDEHARFQAESLKFQ